jgi:hypothetical protein
MVWIKVYEMLQMTEIVEVIHMNTFLEEGDAEICLQGRQYVSLGIEIGQLRDTIARM